MSTQQAKDDFLRNTSEHTMKMHRDDGLYRHLEFSRGGSSIYRFDLITWPGYLTICGDMGTWTFSRIADMFEFFGGDFEKGVNAGYWGEKLQMGTSGSRDEICMEFDEESFCKGLLEWRERYQEDRDEDEEGYTRISNAVDELCEAGFRHEYEACNALLDSDIPNPFDVMEGLTMKRYSHHYLWILHAIVWGIQQYNASKEATNG
ncbi:hypothetical protein [Aeromonas jandaei]|uniref:hypothetical protein n=1 Tax=Aeromonas jandaei TaxID=650 RepID=UPI003D21A30C